MSEDYSEPRIIYPPRPTWRERTETVRRLSADARPEYLPDVHNILIRAFSAEDCERVAAALKNTQPQWWTNENENRKRQSRRA